MVIYYDMFIYQYFNKLIIFDLGNKVFFYIEDHNRIAENRIKKALKAIYKPLLPDGDALSKVLRAY